MTGPEFDDPRTLEEPPEPVDPDHQAHIDEKASELASWSPLVAATTDPSWPAISEYVGVLHNEAMEQLVRADTLNKVAALQGRVGILRHLLGLPESVHRETVRLRDELESLHTVISDEGEPDA